MYASPCGLAGRRSTQHPIHLVCRSSTYVVALPGRELVQNIGREELTELDKFAKALKTTLTEAQKKLEEEEDE